MLYITVAPTPDQRGALLAEPTGGYGGYCYSGDDRQIVVGHCEIYECDYFGVAVYFVSCCIMSVVYVQVAMEADPKSGVHNRAVTMVPMVEGRPMVRTITMLLHPHRYTSVTCYIISYIISYILSLWSSCTPTGTLVLRVISLVISLVISCQSTIVSCSVI